MAIAYHITFGAYGFWLPNDPRGSWSDYVHAPRLRRFGPATKVRTRQSVAHVEHDYRQRMAAKRELQYPAVVFSARQIEAVGRGFGKAIEETGLRVFACAVMPDHVHFTYASHERSNGSLVGQLKSRATKQLNLDSLHPLDGAHTPWAEGHWEVYLDTEDEVFRAIEYVNQNPIRGGKTPQNWPFVISAG
ncbi:MAG: transposase [Planctomycetes bacterium]|nr:transposase [Planctomycetota bacterium]